MGDVQSTRASARRVLGRERIAALSVRDNAHGWVFFLGHLAVTGLSGVVLWAASGGWLFFPALLLHGVVIVHWFAPMHECAHYTAFRSRLLNKLVGRFAALVLILPFQFFEREHNAHHRYTNDPERDPESLFRCETLAGYLFYATSIPYFIATVDWMIRHPFGRFNAAERQFLPESEERQVQREALLMWAVYLTVIGGSVWLGSWGALIYWFLPRLVGEPVMRLIRITEHVGRPRVSDMLENTRTVEAVLPLRLLAWNMCFHVEHHAIPSVPFHRLPDLHADLKPHTADVCSGYVIAHRNIFAGTIFRPD